MQKHYSTSELATLLCISRVAVFYRIKKGDIKARKIGRNFVIDAADLPPDLIPSPKDDTEEIRRAVKKTVNEYGETLRLLGKE